MQGSPDEIIELVDQKVRDAAGKRPEVKERGIHAIDVYEVRFSKNPL
jgi:hypothetical protein